MKIWSKESLKNFPIWLHCFQYLPTRNPSETDCTQSLGSPGTGRWPWTRWWQWSCRSAGNATGTWQLRPLARPPCSSRSRSGSRWFRTPIPRSSSSSPCGRGCDPQDLMDMTNLVRSGIKTIFTHTPALLAFTGVTNAHGPSHRPTDSRRSPICSLTTITGSNQS